MKNENCRTKLISCWAKRFQKCVQSEHEMFRKMNAMSPQHFMNIKTTFFQYGLSLGGAMEPHARVQSLYNYAIFTSSDECANFSSILSPSKMQLHYCACSMGPTMQKHGCPYVEEDRGTGPDPWGLPCCSPQCQTQALQSNKLWPTSQAVHNPGHKGSVYLHCCQLAPQ